MCVCAYVCVCGGVVVGGEGEEEIPLIFVGI